MDLEQFGYNQAAMFGNSLPEIDAKALDEKLKSDEDFVLLDVREEKELLLAKISDRRMARLPLSQLASQGTSAIPESVQRQDRSVYVLCHHGNRSAQVTNWLIKLGWKNIFNVRGGIDDYARRCGFVLMGTKRGRQKAASLCFRKWLRNGNGDNQTTESHLADLQGPAGGVDAGR